MLNLEVLNLSRFLPKSNNKVLINETKLFNKNEILQKKIDSLNKELDYQKSLNLFFVRNNSSILCKYDMDEYRIKNYESFIAKLTVAIPNLTRNERIICGYINNDLSSKDISSITGKTLHSIEIARTRLRKKLKINNTPIGINQYITKAVTQLN